MTRTLSRSRSAAAPRSSYQTRRGVVAQRRRGRRLPGISLPLGKVIYGLFLVFIGLTAIGVALGLVFVALPLALRGAFSLLGFGAVILPPALILWYWRGEQLGTVRTLRTHFHHLAGSALAYTGLLGFASLLRPKGLAFWGTSWSEVSFGGLLGQMVMGDAEISAMLRTGLLVVAGIALVFPSTLHRAGRLTVLVGGLLWGLGLQHYAWQGIRWAGRAALQRLSGGRTRTPYAGDDPLTYNPNQAIEGLIEESVLQEPAIEAPIQSTLLPIIPTNNTGELEEAEAEQVAPASQWDLPSLDLLDRPPEPEAIDQTQRARQLEEALASYGVEGKVMQIHVGPAVTQFGVEPGWDRKYREIRERDADGRFKLDKDGKLKARLEEVSRTRVKVERITGLANNLALALAAPSIRIEAPVPGKQVVGIEVPNVTPGLVPLHSVIESPLFQRLRVRSKLTLALGKAVAGDTVVGDLTKMPHLLIAGATGSGKSVCINAIITCLLMHATPEEVRFLMIDPKRVELVPYNAIPHLLTPVIVDPERVVGTLHWVTREMENRYRTFAAVGVRNIEGYNRSPKIREQMPYWVMIIDELADLMMVAPYEVERALCRLAQLARATGIHLVIATQRPSVDVITGLIKANFPTRISFAVTSYVDSRTILDGSGAEKLLGRGDMLYMATDAAKPKRVQGTYVSDAEVERLVQFWANERYHALRPPQLDEAIEQATRAPLIPQESEDDVLMEQAQALAESVAHISTSFLQRRLRIGYPRAARLMEALRAEGYGDAADDLP